jgi:hypothetical protein
VTCIAGAEKHLREKKNVTGAREILLHEEFTNNERFWTSIMQRIRVHCNERFWTSIVSPKFMNIQTTHGIQISLKIT